MNNPNNNFNGFLNNSNIVNNKMMNTSYQLKQMEMLKRAAHMKRMKYLQDLKKKQMMEKLKNINSNDVKNYVIQPKNLNVTKQEKSDMTNKYKQLEQMYETNDNYKKTTKNIWKQRTNIPYKNIIKDADYNIKVNSDKDLIIHKVTNEDKNDSILEKQFEKFGSTINEHNKELKNMYSQSKELSHKKDFEYNHRYKYRVKFKTKDHGELKQDKIEQYKEEQKKLELNKKKIDDIYESMINNEMFSKEELKQMNVKDNDNLNELIDNTKSDITDNLKGKIKTRVRDKKK